jgi:hypothetical protein
VLHKFFPEHKNLNITLPYYEVEAARNSKCALAPHNSAKSRDFIGKEVDEMNSSVYISFLLILILICPIGVVKAQYVGNEAKRPVGIIHANDGNDTIVSSSGIHYTPSEAKKMGLSEVSHNTYYYPAMGGDASGSASSSASSSVDTSSSTITYRTPYWYTPTFGNPLLITKAITTAESQDRYDLGDEILVYVEITNTKDEVRNIRIREIVDDDLQIITPNGYYSPVGVAKTNDLDKISRLEQEFFGTQSGNIPYEDSARIMRSFVVKDNIYPISIKSSFFLFNWSCKFNSNCKGENEADKNRIREFLRDNYDIDWAKNASVISYCMNTSNASLIYVNRTLNDTNSNDYVTFKVQDIGANKKNGQKVLLNISKERSYILRLNESNGVLKVWDDNSILGFDLDRLSKREKLIYWYYVKPKRSGIFDVDTVARIYDENYLDSPDISNPKEITVKKPELKFEVIPELNKNNVYNDWWSSFFLGLFKDNLNLTYDITFIGEAPDKFIDNIEVKLDKTKTDDIDFDNNSDILDFSSQRT